MSIGRWIFAALVVAGVGLAAVRGLGPRPAPKVLVHTARAAKQTIVHTVSAAGKLEPMRKVNVSSNVTGVLTDLKVGIGSQVKKDQYLGQIDQSRYASQVSQQRAQLQAALADVKREKANVAKLQADVDRVERLVDRGAAGASELEQASAALRMAEANLAAAQSRVQMAQAALAEAQKNVDFCTLRAPVDGTVLAVNHRVGERIRGSDFTEDVVLVLGTVNEMEVRVEVGEHDVVHIRPGQKATIEIDALPGQVLQGEVIDSGRDAIVKNAGTDAEVTTFPVWVALHDPPPTALSGMSAQVTVATDVRPDVVAVPIQAVTVRPIETPPPDPPSETRLAGAPGGPGQPRPPAAPGRARLEKVVFVVKDGVVEKRRVGVGLSSETHLEITSGLAEGEEIVTGPYRTLARTLEPGDEVLVTDEANERAKGR